MTTPDFAYTPLTTRLSHYMGVPPDELAVFDDLPFTERTFKRGETIASRGDPIESVILVTTGWAARTRYTREGLRQIINTLLPGDIITPDVFVLRHMDHAVEALSTTSIRFVQPNDLLDLLRQEPALSQALWWAAAQEDSIVREHVVRLGRRVAVERIAHFILEVHRRLLIVKQATTEAMIMPLTQNEIADALGLSLVHVNKSLRKLAQAKFIIRQRTVIQLLDVPGLAEFCDFDVIHLHLDAASDKRTGL